MVITFCSRRYYELGQYYELRHTNCDAITSCDSTENVSGKKNRYEELKNILRRILQSYFSRLGVDKLVFSNVSLFDQFSFPVRCLCINLLSKCPCLFD